MQSPRAFILNLDTGETQVLRDRALLSRAGFWVCDSFGDKREVLGSEQCSSWLGERLGGVSGTACVLWSPVWMVLLLP